MPASLPPARLDWRDGRTPVSEQFGDVYFSAEDGLAETRAVFLAGVGLPDAWQGREVFTIAETGFGTGLNFLATWDLWRRDPGRCRRLNFVSVEGFPLDAADTARALAVWPELAPLAAELVAALPVRHPGFHRVILDGGAVTLTLLFGEAAAMLARLEAQADAWYLDGFAPSRNPGMWTEALFTEVARLSRPGARLATFTAAGLVRRGLEAAGFRTEKAPGFGRKREMLRAVHTGAPAPSRIPPWSRLPPARPTRGTALVIGAGIAGSGMAAALMRRGWRVTVAERHAAPAPEGSGNPVGIIMPRLVAGDGPERAFHTAAYLFTLRELARLGPPGALPCGVLDLATSARDRQHHASALTAQVLPESLARPVSAAEAATLAGIPIDTDGLWFPDAGCVSPPALCQILLAGADLRTGLAIAALERSGEVWHALDADRRIVAEADLVILANGLDTRGFRPADWLPLVPRRGQITRLAATPATSALRCVLSYEGYLTPAIGGEHVAGATFDPIPDAIPAPPQHPIPTDDARNLAQLAARFPTLFGGEPAIQGSRAALRAMTPDHLPIAGPVPVLEDFRRDFAPLRHGNTRRPFPDPVMHPGLFLAAGFGARGLVMAPFTAELLASQIAGDPWPLDREAAAAIHPARYLVRALKQRTL